MPYLVEAVKSLPERRFDPVNKCWLVPLSERDVVMEFARRYKFQTSTSLEEEKYADIPPLPSLNIEISLKLSLFPYQAQGVAYALEKKRLIIADQPGLGKSQPLTARIATPQGWKMMGQLNVGDRIFDTCGDLQIIEAIYPQDIRPVYNVHFNDGSKTKCDIEHLWAVRDNNRRQRNRGWAIKSLNEMMIMGITELASEYRITSGRKPVLKFEIPITKPLKFPSKKYIIHPYILGMLLGDGSLSSPERRAICISIPHTEIESVSRITTLLPEGIKLRINDHGSCPQYYFTQTKTTRKNIIKEEIKRLGLNVKGLLKFIPTEYMQGSIEQRLFLLKGLMDSDGSIRNKRTTFHTCNKKLAEDITELVQSLGGQTIIREYRRQKKGTEWQVNVRMLECPFWLNRKASQWSKSKLLKRKIQSITYHGHVECRCIKVSSKDALYLTDDFIVTHNTAQAIATVVAADAFPSLVIAPSSLKINWQREWHMWSHKKAMILDDNIKQNFHLYYQAGLTQVFIVNYESLKKYFVQSINVPKGAKLRLNHVKFKEHLTNIFKSVIIDESHRVKSTSTQQTKFTKGIASGKEYILALTGTPVINKPKDLISQLGIIEQMPRFGGYLRFTQRYCSGPQEASNLRELNYMLNLNCFYRRDKQDVLKDLPAKMRQVVLCQISTRREYNEAEANLIKYLIEYKEADDEKIARALRGEVMVQIGILKNISARGKLADVFEFVNDIKESGEKLVLFAHLKEVIQAIHKHYPAAVTITGDDSTLERQQAVDSFQNDPETKLIICSIKAAGVGLTLTASSRVAFVELPWTAADCDQCEDRCHRIGQLDSVTCTYFLGEDTIDEKIYRIIQTKREIAATVTGATEQVEEDIVNMVADLFNQKNEQQ